MIAGGSIHVYGTLRGQAIAGSRDARARIFCRKLSRAAFRSTTLHGSRRYARTYAVAGQVWLDGDSMMNSVGRWEVATWSRFWS